MKLKWEQTCNQWEDSGRRFRITSHIYLPTNTTIFRMSDNDWHMGTFPSLKIAQDEAERLSKIPAY